MLFTESSSNIKLQKHFCNSRMKRKIKPVWTMHYWDWQKCRWIMLKRQRELMRTLHREWGAQYNCTRKPHQLLQRHPQHSPSLQQASCSLNSLRTRFPPTVVNCWSTGFWISLQMQWIFWFILPRIMQRYRKSFNKRFRCLFHVHITACNELHTLQSAAYIHTMQQMYIGPTWPIMYTQPWLIAMNAHAANQ